MPRIALATFVKTPGISPVKTRLAKEIGAKLAEEFYELSVNCVREVMAQCKTHNQNLTPYWAIAESEIAPRWRDFNVVLQGEGGLGERLHRVYESLRRTYEVVVLCGADCPQLSAQSALKAVNNTISTGNFTIGPARDGGFYLLAGSKPIPLETWQVVPYSDSKTCSVLVCELQRLARVDHLEVLNDVDTVTDLNSVMRNMKEQNFELNDAQRQLLTWFEATKAHLIPTGV